MRQRFLQKIAESGDGRPTFVVLDNARIHHAIPEQTRWEWLIDHKMMLWFLPAYSPELNLIEIVWKNAKHHWRSLKTASKDQVKKMAESVLGAYALNKIRFE